MTRVALLRPPQPDDRCWLVGGIGTWWVTARWAIEGARGAEAVEHLMWEGVDRQVVALGASGHPLGLLQLTSVDLRNGHAAIDLVLCPDGGARGSAGALVRDFAFQAFLALPLRKLTLSFVVDREDRDPVFDHRATQEGRLVGHFGDGEARRDLVINSFTRRELAILVRQAADGAS